MARLQILELPEGDGDDRPPFVLIVDEYMPQRYVMGMGQDEPPQPIDQFEGVAAKIGARTVLVFEETIDIPGNDVPLDPDGYPVKMRIEPDFETFRQQVQDEIRKTQGELTLALNVTDWENELTRVRQDRDEARNWARHGYEIGQRHCGWTDHGVAPDWLTEGWPTGFDSCEHLKKAAEYDEALSRVRALPEQPQVMDAQHLDSSGYLHGYGVAIRDAKRATWNQSASVEE
jgi:hypothetical protein